MNTLKALFTLLLAGLILAGCKDNSLEPDGPVFNEQEVIDELLSTSPDLNKLSAKGLKITKNPVLSFDGLQETGTSYLVRHKNGILTVVKSNNLQPDYAYTLWYVYFNSPENCSDGECGEDDLADPDVKLDIVYADGEVTNQSGKAVFIGRAKLNDTEGSVVTPLLGTPAYGLTDANNTEVHLVVRSHGPVIEGLEDEMTSTFAGGCHGFPPELGEPGPNTCEDVQFAVHKP